MPRLRILNLVFAFSALAFARIVFGAGNDAGTEKCGGMVEFDCKSHKVKIGGQPTTEYGSDAIDCGKGGTTKEGEGTIGGMHNVNVVKCGAEINGIAGMGQDGGGRVIHTNNPGTPCPSNKPNGTEPSKSDISKGCLIVHPKLLEHILTNCKGAKLKIVNAGGKGSSKKETGYGGQASGSELIEESRRAKPADVKQ